MSGGAPGCCTVHDWVLLSRDLWNVSNVPRFPNTSVPRLRERSWQVLTTQVRVNHVDQLPVFVVVEGLPALTILTIKPRLHGVYGLGFRVLGLNYRNQLALHPIGFASDFRQPAPAWVLLEMIQHQECPGILHERDGRVALPQVGHVPCGGFGMCAL